MNEDADMNDEIDITIPKADAAPSAADKRRESLAKARAARLANRTAAARTAPQRQEAPRTAADIRQTIEPAKRADAAREAVTHEQPARRRRRDERQTGSFDIPESYRKPGMDYQWLSIRVLNEPVDPARLQDFRENGQWRPEKAGDWPSLVEPGTTSADAPVERLGMRLYSRPKHMTMEAIQEDAEFARRQQADKMRQAASGQSAVRGQSGLADMDRRIVKPVAVEVSLEGVAG